MSIKGFEDVQETLNGDEIEIAKFIAMSFNQSALLQGKDNAKSANKIIDELKQNTGKNLSQIKLRSIINYIRNNNMVYGLCSNSKGYYKAKNVEEFKDHLISLRDRIKMQTYTFNNQKRQYETMLKQTHKENKELF